MINIFERLEYARILSVHILFYTHSYVFEIYIYLNICSCTSVTLCFGKNKIQLKLQIRNNFLHFVRNYDQTLYK